jgi:serine/threonine protein kinase/Flp pilus assembly protein TadD
MECPKCGFDNPSASTFCNKCGTQISPASDISPSPTETLQIALKELAPGSTFAKRYQIIEELGKGGMGRVYEVLDKEIGEKVALKLLNPEIAAEGKTIERFCNELKTARQISHKNVCRMYHLSKEEGAPYIIMEYVRGEDLKSMIRMMGRLSPGQTVSIARQVCEGLVEAHRLGVVHRDLKPQNIMIDRNGDVKIMDFGIARSVSAKGITGAGVMIGTPEYMSPEQAEGTEADERADVYALGIILFEMLTGRVPFEGETPLSIALKHKTEAPPDPREINAQVTDDLARLILRCLEKEKGNRYQSAQELLGDFAKIEKGIPTEEKALPQRKPLTSKEVTVKLRKRWRAMAAVVAVAVVAVTAIVYFGRERPIPTAAKNRIVVLPFENLGPPEDEYFADGITDEITARIASISQLEVIGRSSAIQYKKTDKSPRQIGEELGVTYILSGTVRWQRQPGGASKVRVTPSLVRVSDAMQVWAKPYDETIAEVFQVQSDIALRVAEALNIALLEPEQKALEAKPTNNPEAYDYYLRGREYINRGTENRENVTMSMELFMKAVKLDPDFIQAHAGLARSHAEMYWYHFDHSEKRAEKSKEAADRALKLGPDIAEAHYALGIYYYHCRLDYERALEQLFFALEKEPKNSYVLEYVAYVKRRQGKLAESLDYLKKALKIDPRSIEIITNMGDSYHLLRDYAEAEHYYKQAISLSPDYLSSYISHGSLVWLYLYGLGNTTKTREVLDAVSKQILSLDEEDMLQYNWTLVNIFDKTYQEALDHIPLMPSDAYYDQFMFVPKSQLYAYVHGLMGEKQKEQEYYQSARQFLENKIKEQPDDSRFYSALGIVCAGLGLKEMAIQEAKKATDLLPVSKEFWRGALRVKDLAQVYVMVGEYDKAFDQIEYLLSIPGELSVPLLKLDPVWAPLRELPRFQKIVKNN